VPLYQELRNLAGGEDRVTVDTMIVEEQDHIRQLTERRLEMRRAA